MKYRKLVKLLEKITAEMLQDTGTGKGFLSRRQSRSQAKACSKARHTAQKFPAGKRNKERGSLQSGKQSCADCTAYGVLAYRKNIGRARKTRI